MQQYNMALNSMLQYGLWQNVSSCHALTYDKVYENVLFRESPRLSVNTNLHTRVPTHPHTPHTPTHTHTYTNPHPLFSELRWQMYEETHISVQQVKFAKELNLNLGPSVIYHVN